MNPRYLGWPLVLVVLAMACSPASPPPSEIVLWHAYRGDEAAALRRSVEHYNARAPSHPVRLVGLPYDAFANKLRVAVPGGNGPDLFIFAHDQVGDWAEKGVIEPIGYWVQPEALDRFIPETLEGLVYENALYGLPLAFKTLALYYDQKLIAVPPRTTAELISSARRVRERDPNCWGLGYPVDNFYYHAAWFHGFGGRVMDSHGRVRLNSKAMERSAAFARRLMTEGLVPKDMNGAQVTALFKQNRLAYVIDGPWFRSSLAETGNWAVTTLPVVTETGQPARPYLGIEGLMVSARSRHREEAFKVAQFLTSDAEAARRWSIAKQLVANRSVYKDPAVGTDPIAKAFRAQLARTQVLSNRPVIRQIWTPLARALSQIIVRGHRPEHPLSEAQKSVARAMQ